MPRSREFSLFEFDFVKNVDLMTLEVSHEGRRKKLQVFFCLFIFKLSLKKPKVGKEGMVSYVGNRVLLKKCYFTRREGKYLVLTCQ